MEKTAEQLQEEGRKIAAWGGFVYHVNPTQIPIMVEYQIPFILIELIDPTDPREQEPTSQTSSGSGSSESGVR